MNILKNKIVFTIFLSLSFINIQSMEKIENETDDLVSLYNSYLRKNDNNLAAARSQVYRELDIIIAKIGNQTETFLALFENDSDLNSNQRVQTVNLHHEEKEKEKEKEDVEQHVKFRDETIIFFREPDNEEELINQGWYYLPDQDFSKD